MEDLQELRGLCCCAIGSVLLIAIPLAAFGGLAYAVVHANRAIGQSYADKAAQLYAAIRPSIVREARDAKVRFVTTTWLSAAVQWRGANVWLTPGALYVAQYANVWGKPHGQPIFAFPLSEHAAVAPVDIIVRLTEAPRIDEGHLYLVGYPTTRFLGAKYRVRIALPDSGEWLAALLARRA